MPTPMPTPNTPTISNPKSPSGNSIVPVTTPYIGGPVAPAGYYCIDDQDPDSCDDTSAFLVPKGNGGIYGSCGTVIEQAETIVDSLPHFMKGVRDSLNPGVTYCGYSTGTYSSGYISTFFVIDAFN